MYSGEPANDIRMERTMQRVVLFKNVVIGLGSILIAALAVWNLIQGNWIAALLLFFVAEPVWYFIADIATGILAAPFIGAAAIRQRRR